tara:strand:- start:490 stop:612 length:123 start_codon:yes stop_codon:yes gene_type:complete
MGLRISLNVQKKIPDLDITGGDRVKKNPRLPQGFSDNRGY